MNKLQRKAQSPVLGHEFIIHYLADINKSGEKVHLGHGWKRHQNL